ncbi:MAG: 16S rRNA processing protein RimM [Bacteroidetes bacterium]|nr:16S rRNA processing protein RimM [Bacteroidota bacterium]MBS1685602.1 16S rRNA processing protein RimM [Bacteroidota bacterium]
MADHISVGILRKPHGLSGAFNFSLTRELKSVKKHPAHFFIEGKGGFIPYFIVSFDLKDMFTGLLTFEDIDSVEKAKQMTGCELYLDEKTVGSLFKKDQDDYGFLIGYQAWDGERALGTVAAIEEMPGQVLAVIDMAGEEVMVPLVDDLVAEVDKRKKKIVFELPEGLV